MILRATKRTPIGELVFKQLLRPLEVRHISQHRTVKRLHPWARVAFAQALDGGRFPRKGVKHSRVASHAGSCSTDREIFLVDALMNDLLSPRMFHEHLFRKVIPIPQQVCHTPEIKFLGLRRWVVRKPPQQGRERIGNRNQEPPDVHPFRGCI